MAMTPDEIRAFAGDLDARDYYRLLGVERNAVATAVRDAYHGARRSFHPDSYLDADPEVRAAVERIAKRVTEAYMVLRDPARRSAYDKSLAAGALRYSAEAEDSLKKETAESLGRTPNGRRFYGAAEEAARRGDIPRAIAQLKMALTFEAGNERFKARLAELLAKTGKSA
jgi:DnaJ-class molecular chaperone